MWKEGNAVLTAGGRYRRSLALARLGTLPFFMVSCWLVFALGRRLYSPVTATLALLLFSTLPPVLGYAGLAYTDTALMAGMLAFTVAFLIWLERPSGMRSLGLGVATWFAVASK